MGTEDIVKVKLLREEALVPARGTLGSAGWDLHAVDGLTVDPGCSALVGTGLAMELPVGTYGRLTSRSSMMVKGVNVGPGVVDRDFRGEIKVLVMNGSDQSYVINPGDRVAQMVIEKVYEGELKTVRDLGESYRGSGGFGSTGVRSLRVDRRWRIVRSSRRAGSKPGATYVRGTAEV